MCACARADRNTHRYIILKRTCVPIRKTFRHMRTLWPTAPIAQQHPRNSPTYSVPTLWYYASEPRPHNARTTTTSARTLRHTHIHPPRRRSIDIYIYIYIYHLYTRKETWARSPATSCSGRRSCTPIRCRTTTCRRCCSSVMAKVSGVRYYSTAVCARSRMLYTYTAHVCVGYVKAVAATRRWWLLARCKRCRRVYICGREKTGKQTGNFAGI